MSNLGLAILLGLLPAVSLTFGALCCAAVAALRPATRPSLYRWIALLCTAASITSALFQLFAMRQRRSGIGVVTFDGGLIEDRFEVFGAVLVCAVLLLVLLGSQAYARRAPARAGAFAALLLLTSAAAEMLVAQREMVAFTVAFAVLVMSSVLLTAMTKTSDLTVEAALKQLITAGAATATLVYGLALLYGASGSTDLAQVALGTVGNSGTPINATLAAVGMALVIIGLLVAVGVPPLLQWSRHLIDAAPGPIAAFSTAIGVITGTSVLARFAISGFGAGNPRWTFLVPVLAAIAMLWGAATAQRAASIRQLIADLSMVQAGFLLLAIVAVGRGTDGATLAGPTALLFGLMAAAAALVASLLLAGVFDTAGLGATRDEYRGVGRRSPVTAAMLALSLLALAGAPPLAGFIGRLLIAESALDAGVGWAVAVGALALVLSLVAVLRWLLTMYADDTNAPPFAVTTTPMLGRVAAWGAATLALLIAAFAAPLISLAGGGATALH